MLAEVRRDAAEAQPRYKAPLTAGRHQRQSSPRSLYGCEQALAVGTNPELLEARGVGLLDLC